MLILIKNETDEFIKFKNSFRLINDSVKSMIVVFGSNSKRIFSKNRLLKILIFNVKADLIGYSIKEYNNRSKKFLKLPKNIRTYYSFFDRHRNLCSHLFSINQSNITSTTCFEKNITWESTKKNTSRA